MLTEDLDARQDVRRRQARHLAHVVLHEGRIGNRALDAVLANRRSMRSNVQRDLGAVAQDVADDAFVGLARLVSAGIQSEHGADALDYRGLARAAAAHQYIQIGIEAHLRSVQKPPFPGQGEQLGVFLGLQLPLLGIEAYA